MRHPLRFALTLLLCVGAVRPAAPLAAQSALSASVSGTIVDEAGRTLPRVAVTLRAIGAGADQETFTGNAGIYRFPLTVPGTYEIRAEAIGYQPLVAVPLEISGGDVVRIPLTLRAATPPVIAVDTIALETSTAARARPGGVRLVGQDIDLVPHRFEDLSSVVGLSSHFGRSLGSQGLPGSMTTLVADGLPVYRARHPLFREEQLSDAFFPRTFLSGVTALHNAPDAEWSGGAGGYVAISTLASVPSGVEVDGAWSGDPLWSSNELDLEETPGLTSYQASGRAAVDIKPDTTQLLLASEFLQHDAPMAPRLTDAMSTALTGVDPELLAALGTPSVERLRRYSGLGRFYTQPNETSRVFFRGAVAFSERTFDGAGPLGLDPAPGLGETSTEFSIASTFVSEFRPGLTVEFRGGVSGSSRTFEPAIPGLPSAYLVESGTAIGSVPGGPAESARTDAVFMPLARIQLDERGSVKVGASARASRFTMESATWGAGDFLFTDPSALLAGRGYGRVGAVARSEFTTREFGAFAQYDLSLTPGLDITVGARFDYEMIPSREPIPNPQLRTVTGLANSRYPSSFPEVGGGASISWDPSNDGLTRVFALGTLHTGDVDPAHLFEAFTLDGGPEVETLAGTGLTWPDGTIPPNGYELPTLALLGPGTRPPRSLRGTLGLVRHVAGGLSLHVSGDFRRTDFLMRRRNLNLPQTPSARDRIGANVYGTLDKDGALVTAASPDARRFSQFGPVWALDPDGWSEYLGVTGGLELRSEWLDLFGAVTRSETVDNWIGAGRGSAEAELSPRLPEYVENWAEARSDFDVPTRATATAVVRVPSLPETSLSATYRYSSGRPFTPRYRRGVDANGDGSFENDVVFVPQPEDLGALHEDRACLRNQAGGYAVRNSCRGPSRKELDVRLRIGLGRIAGQAAGLFIDGLDLLESEDGLIDDALLLVDPDADLTTSDGGARVRVPVEVNPGFGRVLVPTTRGRMIRIGMRIGG